MTSLALKVIAVLAMTLDHIGFMVPKLSFLRIPGRLAFPLYVFLLTMGFRHSSNRLKYALRLFAFALLSQLPYTLMFAPNALQTGTFFAVLPEEMLHNGNMMFSLLISMLCLWALDAGKGKIWSAILSWLAVLGVFVLYHTGCLNTDYGARCIFLTLVFYFFYDHPVWMGVGAFLGAFYFQLYSYLVRLIRTLSGTPQTFNLPDKWMLTQFFGLFALPVIFLYNGEKGWTPRSRAGKKAMQLGFYAYYPLHMLALVYLLRTI